MYRHRPHKPSATVAKHVAKHVADIREQFVAALHHGVREVLRYDKLRLALHSDSRRRERTAVLAIGKAALSMADAATACLSRVSAAMLVVPRGHVNSWNQPIPFSRCAEVVEGDHPLPGEHSIRAASAVERFMASLSEEDDIVVLLSGGGSALIAAPAAGLDEGAWRDVTARLYKSGADIKTVNAIRRGINRLAGGGLARLDHVGHGSRISTFVLSDVPGDNPCLVASGPTCVPTESDVDETWRELATEAGREVADEIRRRIADSDGDLRRPQVVGTNRDAIDAVADRLRGEGFEARGMYGVFGEARDVGRSLADLAATTPGTVIVFGGETTVTVAGDGQGGRCQELVVSAAAAIESRGLHGVVACIGTDGRDGPTDAAGAAVTVSGTTKWQETGAAALARNDAYPLLESRNALIRTGPTHTNVMDVGAILVL